MEGDGGRWCFGVDTSPDDIDAVDSVEADRTRGVENVSRIARLVADQRKVHDRLIKVVGENDDVKGSKAADLKQTRNTDLLYPIEDVKFNKKGMFNPSRMFNGCSVAKSMMHDKDRKNQFQRRRRQCILEEEERNEAVKQTHAASDKLVVLRQKEMVEKQELIIEAAQNRANEQQKMCKDLQRIEANEFEQLQLQHHPLNSSKLKEKKEARDAEGKLIAVLDPPPSSRQGSKTECSVESRPSSSSGSKALSGSASEPVFQKTVESHKGYSATIQKWRVYVADNERRTDKHWEKTCNDPALGSKRDRPEAKRNAMLGVGMFRKAVKDLSSVRKFLSKTQTCHAPPNLDPDDTQQWPQQFETPDGSEWNEEDFSSMCSVNTSQFLTGPRSNSEVYAERLQRNKDHFADLEEQGKQKFERDEMYNQEKRRLGKAEMDKKANKAKEYLVAWENRNDTAERRRQEYGVSSDQDMMQRLADFKEKRQGMDAERDEELSILTAANQRRNLENLEAGQANLEQTTSGYIVRQEEKDRMGVKLMELRHNKQAAFGDRSGDAAKAMQQQKKIHEHSFRKATKMDIEKKAKRTERAKFLVNKAETPELAFDRHRILRQEKSTLGPRKPPPELAFAPGWDKPEEEVFDALGSSCISADSGLHQSPGKSPSLDQPHVAMNTSNTSAALDRTWAASPNGEEHPRGSTRSDTMSSNSKGFCHSDTQRSDMTLPSSSPFGRQKSSCSQGSTGRLSGDHLVAGGQLGDTLRSVDSRRSSVVSSHSEECELEAQVLEDMGAASLRWMNKARKAREI